MDSFTEPVHDIRVKRMVIEVDPEKYHKLRGKLLAERNVTLTKWVRDKIDEELARA